MRCDAMDASKLMDKFHQKCPFAVLTQAAMRGVIADEFDDLFEEHRSQQYEKTLTFSAMATAVADVVLHPAHGAVHHSGAVGVPDDAAGRFAAL
jgi:hypothetical protein